MKNCFVCFFGLPRGVGPLGAAFHSFHSIVIHKFKFFISFQTLNLFISFHFIHFTHNLILHPSLNSFGFSFCSLLWAELWLLPQPITPHKREKKNQTNSNCGCSARNETVHWIGLAACLSFLRSSAAAAALNPQKDKPTNPIHSFILLGRASPQSTKSINSSH